MSNIKELNTKRQVISEEFLQDLESIIARARAGELTDMVMVCAGKDDEGMMTLRATEFQDRWRLLGALEYAKAGVLTG